MRHVKTLAAVAVVVAEIVSVGLAATPASAQDNAPTQRQVRRQQRLIQQQQRQIREYQRQLASQQQTASDGDMGLLGVLGCPRGYTYSWFGKGCYPNLPAQVIVTTPRY